MRTTIAIVASLVLLINCHTALAQPGAPGSGGGGPLTCIVVGDEVSCSDLFPEPAEQVFCPAGTPCVQHELFFHIYNCADENGEVDWEVRNLEDYSGERPQASVAGDEEAGVEGQLVTRICTAKRECRCHRDPGTAAWYCVLGDASTQVNINEFTYAFIPTNGGQSCVGDIGN